MRLPCCEGFDVRAAEIDRGARPAVNLIRIHRTISFPSSAAGDTSATETLRQHAEKQQLAPVR